MSHKKILPIFFKIIFLIFLFLIIASSILFFKKPFDVSDNIKWGLAFSQTFANELGLDWKKTYIEILDDLKPKDIRLPVYWPEVEAKKGKLDFSDYDFMMDEAEKRKISVILVVGERVPRWPECHVPDWTKNMKKGELQEDLLKVIKQTVNRYKDRGNLKIWQVENEPFLPYFGTCDFVDVGFLDKEIALVRSLDPNHKIMLTDSGELSLWLPAAKRADVFGTTMYRTVWSTKLSKYFGYITYPLPPKFFWFKANLVRLFYGNKPIIVSELQAEPWSPGALLSELPEEEQRKSMDIKKFHQNIEYARNVGFGEVYLWGTEWWYFQKEKKNNPSYWNAAKELFKE